MNRLSLLHVHNPKSILVVVFLLSFSLLTFTIFNLHTLELEKERAKVQMVAANYSYDIKFNLERALSSNYTLQALLAQNDDIFVRNFEEIAEDILPSFPGVIELAIVPAGIIAQVAPLKGNEKAVGLNLFESKTQSKESFLARDSGKLTLAGPLELVQGGIGLVGRLPIFKDKDNKESFLGFVLSVIRVSDIFDNVKIAQLEAEGVSYEVWRIHPDTHEKQIIFKSAHTQLIDPIVYAFEVPNNTWAMSLAPTNGWGSPLVFMIREIIALIFALMLSYMAKILIELKLAKIALESKVIQTTGEKNRLERQLKVLLDAVPDLIWLKDPNGFYLFCNRAFERLYGAKEKEIVGKSDYDFVDRQLADFFRTHDVLAMDAQEPTRNEEELHFKEDGYSGLFETIKAPVYDKNSELLGVLGISRDITARKENEERIQKLEYFDPLTNLPNKLQLRIRLEHDLNIVQRQNEQLAVLFIDFDHFKNINDTLGHTIGDDLLVKVSKRLTPLLRPVDTLSRQGGDEFVAILPSVSADDAAHIAKKFLQAIELPIRLDNNELIITASIGIALFPDDGADIDTLFRCADAAMYLAKQNGRNNYRFFTAEIQSKSARILSLENALRYAHTRGELSLHYQPQISLCDGKIVGVEALIRWHHPEFGMISPVEFIPIAEESGQILLIGEWVMRTAATMMKQWIDMGFAAMSVSVNLSAVQFHHAHLSKLVSTILDEVNLPAHYFEIELTESATAQNPLHAIETMNELSQKGIRLSIDDFGTGYSSLSYLKRFKVYKLKIDQSFIRDISIDPEDREIVKTIIALGKSLGLKTIAEGVETKEQLDYLKEQGCDEAQGYYFSKPLNVTDLETLLRAPEIIERKNNSSLQ
ncbi:bifunctional diguanylate cyclase/phosphodiesterase [Sulfurospirillum oryzae]|uniref:bifunctional diguanylate cyclase/phosphodiesterase n=1 Tax=Sulfurospirillum oryzae TaxID=2976535 RepID=UPI0021E94FE4|nr:EAL domain-containing protein [Sulfurospirillum oryzae]